MVVGAPAAEREVAKMLVGEARTVIPDPPIELALTDDGTDADFWASKAIPASMKNEPFFSNYKAIKKLSDDREHGVGTTTP